MTGMNNQMSIIVIMYAKFHTTRHLFLYLPTFCFMVQSVFIFAPNFFLIRFSAFVLFIVQYTTLIITFKESFEDFFCITIMVWLKRFSDELLDGVVHIQCLERTEGGDSGRPNCYPSKRLPTASAPRV